MARPRWFPQRWPDTLYQKGHKGSLMGTWFPQSNYQSKLPYTIPFQCTLMSNHEIYEIGHLRIQDRMHFLETCVAYGFQSCFDTVEI